MPAREEGRGVKRHDNLTGQKRRRQERLLRQKSQREDAAARARQLAEGGLAERQDAAAGLQQPAAAAAVATVTVGAASVVDAAAAAAAAAAATATSSDLVEGTDDRGGDCRRRRQRRRPAVDLYVSELMVPEWMIGVPDDLATQWYVVPRPQGKRCLVVANAGMVTARIRNGSQLERFTSHIPGGGRSSGQSSGHYTILDCILHKGPEGSDSRSWTYYVVDCMCWNGHAVYDCATEFRLFWLQSKLSEVGADVLSRGNKRRFLPLPCFPATPDGIAAAYGEQFGFVKDCLLFLNRETEYQAGVTPLALLWKDSHCSAYFIESRSAGHEQIVSLVLGPAGELNTADDPPMTIGMLPPIAELQALNLESCSSLQPGDPVRCVVRALTVGDDPEETGGQIITGAAVEVRGRGGQARAGADSWSKIIFQYHARTEPLQVGELVMEAARSAAADSAADLVAAADTARALAARLVRMAELSGGAEAAAAPSVALAAAEFAAAGLGSTEVHMGMVEDGVTNSRRVLEATMDVSSSDCPHLFGGSGGATGGGGEELRVDPADGNPYSYDSFVQCYGLAMADVHWDAAVEFHSSSSSGGGGGGGGSSGVPVIYSCGAAEAGPEAAMED
jgi:snurportin-1